MNSFAHTLRMVTVYIGDATIPRQHRKHIERYLRSAGIVTSPQFLFGLLCHLVVITSFVSLGFLVSSLSGAPLVTMVFVFILGLPFVFFLFLLLGIKIFQLYVDARIYRRVREMEEEFPEFLAEVSLNIKAGRSLETAIAMATKEDFGLISEQMAHVTTRVSLGFDLGASLHEFSKSFPSDVMGECLELIYISWRKGARTPRLIDRMVQNMKLTRHLREKISASVASYQIFLGTVTLLITPAMLALAFHFLDLVRAITTQVRSTTTGATLPITINAVTFNEQHFLWFSCITVVLIATFSCMIISYTTSGSIKSAWKQMFLYAALSLGSYAMFMALFGLYFRFLQPG